MMKKFISLNGTVNHNRSDARTFDLVLVEICRSKSCQYFFQLFHLTFDRILVLIALVWNNIFSLQS